MPLPQKLTKFTTISPAIVSFSSEDIATGLGVVLFYGIASEASGGIDFHLVTNKDSFSSPTSTARNTTGTTSIDFDTSPFNLTRTAKGTAYISFAMGAAENVLVHLNAQLIHYDGSTETTITSNILSATHTGGTGSDSQMAFLELPITEKIFRTGDILRLTAELVTENNGDAEMGHDPKNQNGINNSIKPSTKDTTVMLLTMSFKNPE